MVQIRRPNVQGNPPALQVLNQGKFPRGVLSIIDKTNLPRPALETADNSTLIEDGSISPRPGVDYYGTAATGSGDGIDGAGMHVTSDDVVHLLKVTNGTLYRSLNDGATWTSCTGASFTAGAKVSMEQINDFTYLANGEESLVRYDGTTTLQTYTALTTPTGVGTAKTGLSGTTYTYRYRVSALNDIGETIASTASTVQVNRTRDSFDASNFVTFTWGAVTGANGYAIYVGQTSGEEVYIDSVDGQASTTYIDQGQAIEQIQFLAPDSDTTSGPRAADVALVGSRLYATGDADFPYRVWISGSGRLAGQFGSSFDSTWVDLQKGGQNKPVKVEDYRDGKGLPLATVWCKSKDGLGSVWQGTLESFTVGDITFPVPNFNKLPGSRGTDAPFSVVNVLNDFMYYNSQAFYNLGSRAQFLNLLSTDEASVNVRPDVQSIRPEHSSKITAHYQTPHVYFSCPVGSDENDTTFIYDTERKAWLPRGFTIGFERFFTYSDSNGNRRLLCWKSGDHRLSEISTQIRGDYGQAFTTTVRTGINHVNPKDRSRFMWVEEAFVEFAQTRGTITVELLANTREEGFKTIDTVTISPDSSLSSWDTFPWDTEQWDVGTGADAVAYSEPTVKRYFLVDDDINAYQLQVTTNSVNAYYVLRTLQISGSDSEGEKPRPWEVFSSQ